MISTSKPKLAEGVPLEVLVPQLFDRPRIVGICSDVGQGKSNMIYAMLHALQEKYMVSNRNLYTYALPISIGQQMIYSVEELELIENSIIILDEFFLFLDLDDRKKTKQLAAMFQRIQHANNVLVMCGLPFNFNKFVSSQINVKIYKQTTLKNLINGSPMKDTVISYNGNLKGYTVLKVPQSQALIFGLGAPHYILADVPYYKQYDVKLALPDILTLKKEK
jgi:hypothetical protein